MREIKKVIVHCSATRPSSKVTADTIRSWHVHNRKWRDIGYHYVIERSGNVVTGRPLYLAGAHTIGHNRHSIGICLVGGINEETGLAEANFTYYQYKKLVDLLLSICDRYSLGLEDVFGHRDFANRSCPCFDIKEFLRDLL